MEKLDGILSCDPCDSLLGSLKDVLSTQIYCNRANNTYVVYLPVIFPLQLLDEFCLSSFMFPFNLSMYISLHLLFSLYIFSISDNSFVVVSSVVLYYVPLFSRPQSITCSIVSSCFLLVNIYIIFVIDLYVPHNQTYLHYSFTSSPLLFLCILSFPIYCILLLMNFFVLPFSFVIFSYFLFILYYSFSA